MWRVVSEQEHYVGLLCAKSNLTRAMHVGEKHSHSIISVLQLENKKQDRGID